MVMTFGSILGARKSLGFDVDPGGISHIKVNHHSTQLVDASDLYNDVCEK